VSIIHAVERRAEPPAAEALGGVPTLGQEQRWIRFLLARPLVPIGSDHRRSLAPDAPLLRRVAAQSPRVTDSQPPSEGLLACRRPKSLRGSPQWRRCRVPDEPSWPCFFSNSPRRAGMIPSGASNATTEKCVRSCNLFLRLGRLW
jgi:hypothetical protein